MRHGTLVILLIDRASQGQTVDQVTLEIERILVSSRAARVTRED